MAIITPTHESPANRATMITWDGAATGDTINSFLVAASEGCLGCVQVTGTFGGATAVLQKSNDGTNWVSVADVNGDAISLTSAGMAEFSTAALFLRVALSGGTGDSLTAKVVLRR